MHCHDRHCHFIPCFFHALLIFISRLSTLPHPSKPHPRSPRYYIDMSLGSLSISQLTLLHTAHVLSCLTLTLLVFLSLTSPYIHTHPPPIPSSTPSYLTHLPSIPSAVAQALNNLPVAFLCQPSITRRGLILSRRTNFLLTLLLLLSGDIQLNPGPSFSFSHLGFAHLNIHSASSITESLNKPAVLHEFVVDYGIDILALTETWLPPDSLPATLNSITPPGFSLIHCPRPVGRGGGVALLHRSYLKVSKSPLITFSSFEALSVQLTTSSTSYTILTVYRPPTPSLFNTFISEFSLLLQDLATSPSELIITGDFNIHVNDPTDACSSSFLTLLQTFSLTQHVNFPTHTLNNTLDLLITRSTSSILSNVSCLDPMLSDHFAVFSLISSPPHSQPPRITKQIRNIKSVNPILFSNDILASSLYSCPSTTLNAYLHQFSTTVSSLLDKHAPFKAVSCSSLPRKPFITPEIKAEKAKRSKLETLFRKNKFTSNRDSYKENFKQQAKKVTKLITAARRTYFRSLISSLHKQPKKLWSALDSLLSRKSPHCLPTSLSPSHLAASFLQFFEDKVTSLCSAFPSISSTSPVHSTPPTPPPPLSSFQPATEAEVRAAILSSSNATCTLDLIPTPLLKSCIDALVLPITAIINLALSEGLFPDDFKHAIVTPLLKKPSLPQNDLSSYRPISNLNFISKTLERIIHTRLTTHLATFPSLCPFQSAYRKFHSTETALLCIYNDLLLAINKQRVSALILLDLSAAFDTIDHSILLTRLANNFGLTDTALSLLSSYLHNRAQSVSISSHISQPSLLLTGVPQGSVLGPLLFCLYTTPLSYIFSDSSVAYHFYADDTQLYISFSGSQATNSLLNLSSTLDSVHSWLTSNRLSVNPAKTEYLLIGTPQQRAKVTSSSILFCGNALTPVTKCRNLGVIFDSDLTFKSHISSICSSSFYHIRRLRQIRSSLNTDSAIVLANSLVTSKLDYCNSLFYDLPATSLDRLQTVQNVLARVVVPTVKRFDHISPTLVKLHWLPIRKRITYKIASLTFKTLTYKQPTYLFSLLTPYSPVRSLRSSCKHLLTIPNVRSVQSRRSFAFAAPTIWNALPDHLRSCTCHSSFHSGLKTYLFPP